MIRFEVIDATFNLRRKNAIKNWINEIILSKNRKTGSVNYLFASDEYVSTGSTWVMTTILTSLLLTRPTMMSRQPASAQKASFQQT